MRSVRELLVDGSIVLCISEHTCMMTAGPPRFGPMQRDEMRENAAARMGKWSCDVHEPWLGTNCLSTSIGLAFWLSDMHVSMYASTYWKPCTASLR